MSFSFPYLSFLGRRYQDWVTVAAISAEKKNGRAKERERNKMDYSASVALPWHMASIPWVPERLSSGVAQASQWLDWGMDGLAQIYVVMPLCKWQVYHKKGETCRDELLWHFLKENTAKTFKS